MHTIGIVGANGQVGVELCLFLGLFEGARPIALCRSTPASAFLRRCGIECRTGDLTSPEQARRMLDDCDVVFDLSLPKGLSFEVRSASDRTIRSILAGSRSTAKYVFASTIMAFGQTMSPGARLRSHALARTVYGAQKRSAERAVAREGRRAARVVWLLRIGQVHGEMQGISRILLQSVDERPTLAPDRPSNTVFVFSIAEALVRIAEGREEPGLYTLVSTPQWTWRDVHEHYAARRGVTPLVVDGPKTSAAAGPALRARRWVTARAAAALAARRAYLDGYLLHHVPALEWKAKAAWLRRSAAAQIRQSLAEEVRSPYRYAFEGDAPGRRLTSLSDSRTTMEPLAEAVRGLLQRAAPPPWP